MSVTESKLEQSRADDVIDLGQFDVTVTIQVSCREYVSQVAADSVLERGGCDCE